MTAIEVLSKYLMDESKLVITASGYCLSDSAILEAMEEYAASRESAVPSEELTKLYVQFDTMRNMFTDNNIGIYKFMQAMISLGDAISHFKYFEKQRGIAG